MSLEDLDLAAAIRCARFLSAQINRANVPLPAWLADHLAALETAARSSAIGTRHVVAQAESELIGTTEAAHILGCSTRYVRKIHNTLDGRRIGNRWAFPER